MSLIMFVVGVYVGYSFNSWKNSIVFLQFVDNVKERAREFLKK